MTGRRPTLKVDPTGRSSSFLVRSMGDKRRVLCVNFVLVVTKLLVTKNTKNTQRSQSCSPDRNRTCIKSLGNFYSIH